MTCKQKNSISINEQLLQYRDISEIEYTETYYMRNSFVT